jgi:hypothetical protein
MGWHKRGHRDNGSQRTELDFGAVFSHKRREHGGTKQRITKPLHYHCAKPANGGFPRFLRS